MFGFMNLGLKTQGKNTMQIINQCIDRITKGSITTEELLGNEDYLTDLKSSSSKLAFYFNKTQRVKEVLDLIIIEPVKDEFLRGHKLPFNACELMCSDNLIIIEKFFLHKINTMEKEKEMINTDKDRIRDKEIGLDSDRNETTNGEKTRDSLHDKVKAIIEEVENNKEKFENPEELNVNQLDEQQEKNKSFDSFGNTKEYDKEDESLEYILDTELLDYLFKFLEAKNLNYVLAGYFSKIFSHFLNLRQELLMRYIFLIKPESINLLLNHISMKSIVDCLFKVIISHIDETSITKSMKMNLVKDILKKHDPLNFDISTNISELLYDLLSIRKVYADFINDISLMESIFNFVISNINNESFVYHIKILQKVNENILKDFGDAVVTPVFTITDTQDMFFYFINNITYLMNGTSNLTSNEIQGEEESKENSVAKEDKDDKDDKNKGSESVLNTQQLQEKLKQMFNVIIKAFKEIINNFIDECKKDNSIDNSTNNERRVIDTAFYTSVKMLGQRRISEVEYFRSIIEVLVNTYTNEIYSKFLDLDLLVECITSSNIVEYLIKVLVDYPFNSVYQKEFENIITLLCNQYTKQPLIQHFLSEKNLLKELIHQCLIIDFQYPSGRKIQSALFASLCEICSIINDSKNNFIKEELDKESKWSDFAFFYIVPIKTRFTEGLLTFSLSQTEIIQDSIFSAAPLDPNTISASTGINGKENGNNEEKSTKLSLSQFVQVLSKDFISGRRSNSIEKEIEEVKEEMELVNEESEDQYNIVSDGLHPSLMHYGVDRQSVECNDFYDNNYWSSSLIIDEIDLSELTK